MLRRCVHRAVFSSQPMAVSFILSQTGPIWQTLFSQNRASFFDQNADPSPVSFRNAAKKNFFKKTLAFLRKI